MDYPSNSKNTEPKKPERPAKEPKKVERVAIGEVVRRKKPLNKRFIEVFFGGASKGVLGYVLNDVLIPAAKDMVADATSTTIERTLFGETRSRSRRGYGAPSSGGSGYISYNSPFTRANTGRREENRSVSRRARSSHNFDEIIMATRVEAEEVIDRLFDLVDRYESASVADLYEMVGVAGNYTDDKWGWTELPGAGVTRVRNGYLLNLPKPEALD